VATFDGRRKSAVVLSIALLATALWAAPGVRAEHGPGPATGPSEVPSGSSAESSSASGLIECDRDIGSCPPPPRFVSATPTETQITLEWEWDETDEADLALTGTRITAQPGAITQTFDAAARIGSLAGLKPGVTYTLIAQAIVGPQLSTASEPIVVTTQSPLTTKPFAQAGDISRLIVTTTSAHDPVSATERVSADLPVEGVTVQEVRDLGDRNVVIELDDGISATDAAVIIQELQGDPRIASVEVDTPVRLTTFPSSPPDDTYWVNDSLWGLYGTYGIGIAPNRSTMGPVWGITQGSGAVVAVLDTGYIPHPDLDGNLVSGYDFVSNTIGTCRGGSVPNSDGDYVDTATYGALGWDDNPLDPGDWTTVTSATCGIAANSSWHGTHVSGTISARANNALGIVGVAPEAKVQPIRVLSYDGGWGSDVIAAINWASGGTVDGVPANTTPADVINLSLGGAGMCSPAWQTAIDAAVARGAIVVAAAGNSNQDVAGFVPANCNNVVTVASTTSTGARSSFSNFGSGIDIAAPGSAIWSTVDSGTTRRAGATYKSVSGTSMAAPHVSAVAALLRSFDPTITPVDMTTRIQASATTFPTVGGAFQCTTSSCGAGLLSATAIPTSAPNVTSVAPATGSTAGGTRVTLTGANLTGARSVTFGGAPGTSLTVTSATSVMITTPAGTVGVRDVVIATPTGTATLANAFTYEEPPPPPSSPSAPSGGGSSGGGGSSESSPSAGGGDVNAIRVISPSTSGAPGSLIALAGWGLETTRAVNFNDFSADFTVVNGGHVEVVVPDIPPGVYIVHAVLAPEVGRTSYWPGFSVTARSAASVHASPTPSPATETPDATADAPDTAELLTFPARSTALTPAMRSKLERLAQSYDGVEVRGTIRAFTDQRGASGSRRLATLRAQGIRQHLIKSGLRGSLDISIQRGGNAAQSRSMLIRLAPAATTVSTNPDQVTSLIVRLKPGRSITVNGQVRGANRLTGSLRTSLSAGPALGFRMHRVDFAQPVSASVARRVATQLAKDPGIEFVEPDTTVSRQVSQTR
jgi:serine protease